MTTQAGDNTSERSEQPQQDSGTEHRRQHGSERGEAKKLTKEEKEAHIRWCIQQLYG